MSEPEEASGDHGIHADVLQLSNRARNCLLRGGIVTISDLSHGGGHVRLVAPNERFAPIEAAEGQVRMVGVVVGRLAERE